MNAFGRKNSAGQFSSGSKPSFGVARPMKGASRQKEVDEQAAGLMDDNPGVDLGFEEIPLGENTAITEAMNRLNDRVNSINASSVELQGFEASVHKIKEQILPRLLERVDPEAASTLNKEELSEEFRPIILEVLAELKITLNRREQFALEKVLIDELLGFAHWKNCCKIPTLVILWSMAPNRPILRKKVIWSWRPHNFVTKPICYKSRNVL